MTTFVLFLSYFSCFFQQHKRVYFLYGYIFYSRSFFSWERHWRTEAYYRNIVSSPWSYSSLSYPSWLHLPRNPEGGLICDSSVQRTHPPPTLICHLLLYIMDSHLEKKKMLKNEIRKWMCMISLPCFLIRKCHMNPHTDAALLSGLVDTDLLS